MGSTAPDWPPGLGFGPGDVATLRQIHAGHITRVDTTGYHGTYVAGGAENVGRHVRLLAERGYVHETSGSPSLTERGARVLAEYGELAQAHLDWQWAAARARRE